MASDDETPTTEPEANTAAQWLSKRAGLLVLVAIVAIVGVRLMSSWIKWMLIALVVAAIVYFIKSARRGDG